MYASSKAETEETEAENTAAETTEEEEDEAEDANVPSKPPAPGASRGAALLAAAATGDPAAEGTGTSRRLVSSPRVICAVDFGTTFTGFAFASTTDHTVKTFTAYPSAPPEVPYVKTRSELFVKDGAVSAWGWEAVCQAAAAKAGAGALVSRVKLCLAPGGAAAAAPAGAPSLPAGTTAASLVAATLARVSALAKDAIKRDTGAEGRDVQWVLTLPALWDERAKAAMASAAAAAGMVAGAGAGAAAPPPPGASSHPLLTVLEPEAASVHVHAATEAQLDAALKAAAPVAAAGGTAGEGEAAAAAAPATAAAAPLAVLLLDAGGGTADCAVHVRVRSGADALGRPAHVLREVATGAGALAGAADVDAALERAVAAALPPGAFDAFAGAHPAARLRLAAALAARKHAFDGLGGADGQGGVALEMPKPLADAVAAAAAAAYADDAAAASDDEEAAAAADAAADGVLQLSGAAVRGAFAPTVAAIVALVKAQLAAAAAAGVRVAAVVAVGGFSASPFLVSELRAAVGRDLPVIRPPASGEAVLRGAVAFGLRPGVIASRVARKTYGLSAARPWAAADAGTALKQFVNEETGQLYADGVFSKFVSVGEEVPADATIVNFFLPLSCRSTAVQAALYASDDPAPVSVHDAGTVRLGNISVGVPKFTGAGRPIEVSFRFGDAAIAVEAHDMTGGAKKTVSISFECAFV